MNPSFLLLQYLCFMNAGIGLTPAFTTEHCAVFDSGSEVRKCNGVSNADTPTVTEIERIKSFFGDRPFTWIVDANDTQTRQALENNKLYYMIEFPAMSLELGSLQPQDYGPDIIVKKINAHTTNQLSVSLCIDIIARSFGADTADFLQIINLCTAHITPGVMTLYVGYYQGQPVAVGMTLQHGTTATLHWISTLSEYRHKGLGYAITHTALMAMQEADCTKALLLATRSGRSLYERIGFKEYATYAMYGNF